MDPQSRPAIGRLIVAVERGGVRQQDGRTALNRRPNGAGERPRCRAGADQPRGLLPLGVLAHGSGARHDGRVGEAAPFAPRAVIDGRAPATEPGQGQGQDRRGNA